MQLERRVVLRVLAGERDVARVGRAAVAEAAVDALLRGPERGDRLAALVRVVEVPAHQRAQHAASPVRRRDAHDRRPAALDRTARHGQAERHRPRAPDHRVAVPRAEHAIERGDAREPPGPRLGAVRAEVLPDLHERALELGFVGDGTDLEAHPLTFSSGAYSSISRRSEPSSKRTVTTPSGSMRVTIPVPSVWWRTASPVASDGSSSSFGGGELARRRRAVVRPRRRPQALALDAVLGQLVEEARRQVRVGAAVERAAHRVRHRQPLLGPRHADVAEPPLLLDVVLLDRAHVREDPVLHPEHEHGAELQALGVVQRHQRDLAGALVGHVVLGRVQRDLLEELRQRRLVAPAVRGDLVLARHADELLEVLDAAARLDRPLGLERLEIAGPLEHALDQLGDGDLQRDRHERLQQAAQRLHRAQRRCREADLLGAADRVPERAADAVGERLEARERRVPHPAPRPVRDARQRDRVGRVVEHLQVGDRVLDLGPLVEPRPADHLVVDALPHEDVLQHAALGIGSVNHGHLGEARALVEHARDLGGDVARLGVLVLDLDDAHRLALAEVGPELLLLALAVVLDDRVGRVEDAVRRAVVLLQRDHGRPGEVALELEDVADVRAAEAVDALVRVADHHEIPVLTGHQLEQDVLRVVRVLVLVHEDVAERLRPALTRLGEALQHVDGQHEQVVEVDRVRGEHAALVEAVDVGDGLVVEARDAARVLVRADQLVLRVRDLGVDAARREALRVAVELRQAVLHEADLVGGVVDREVRAVAEPLRLAAQDAAAGGVEGEDPDRPGARPDRAPRCARASPARPCS